MAMEGQSDDYARELERQLEERNQRIQDLKHSLNQKDELFLATTEKLALAEHKRIELETSLMNLATDKDEDQVDCNDDNFIASNCRAAKLEQENGELKYKLTHLASALADFNQLFHEVGATDEAGGMLKKLLDLAKVPSSSVESSGGSANVQLHVKMELEHERRVRTQKALDEAERKYYVLQRELEGKEKECQEYSVKIKDLKFKHDGKIRQASEEHKRLEKLVQLKESEVMDSESRAKELVMRAEEFEEMFNGQLQVVKRLQADLDNAYNDKKTLVKEMEALNQMFNSFEHRYVDEALKNYKGIVEVDADVPESEDNPKIVANDVLAASAELEGADVTEDSCFKEVKTKTGTRMVLSVSKTFMKLRDLILEKKTLEDQVEKMKAINTHLCSRVNLHEEKLFNVTDELNKTWSYVSTLKLQHKQLHTSEQVLRAELTEKRQLLSKLREELEFSRESWNIVKQKTADSEREWRALRDEFAARKRMFPPSSSESGFSDQDVQTEDEAVSGNTTLEEALSPEMPELEVEADILEPQPENESAQVLITEISEDPEETSNEGEVAKVDDEPTIPLFIPSLNYLAHVTSDMMPPLFPSDLASGAGENYQELYRKLIASTARSAALANQLAEMHRNMQHPEDADDEEDVDPKTDDESIVNHEEESEILTSEVEEVEQEQDEGNQESEEELEDLGLSPEAIEQALANSRFNDEDTISTTTSLSSRRTSLTSSPPPDSEDEEAFPLMTPQSTIPSPPPPPPPTFSLIPPPANVNFRSAFDYANLDSLDDTSTDVDSDTDDPVGASENATAVTRFLIKRLPKQLSRLKNEKAELEEKIQDLEQTISNLNQAMLEMERRVEVYKKEAETARKWNSTLSLTIGKSNNENGTKDQPPPQSPPISTTTAANSTTNAVQQTLSEIQSKENPTNKDQDSDKNSRSEKENSHG